MSSLEILAGYGGATMKPGPGGGRLWETLSQHTGGPCTLVFCLRFYSSSASALPHPALVENCVVQEEEMEDAVSTSQT